MKDAAAKAKAEGHEAAEAYEKYVQQNAEELWNNKNKQMNKVKMMINIIE